MTLPRLFTRDDLREYLGGISSSTLARWVDDGKIPGPIASTTRWDRAAVAAMEPELQKMLGALADIGGAEDMDEQTRRRKATRIYAEVAPAIEAALMPRSGPRNRAGDCD